MDPDGVALCRTDLREQQNAKHHRNDGGKCSEAGQELAPAESA
jgi:hypothetical protein